MSGIRARCELYGMLLELIGRSPGTHGICCVLRRICVGAVEFYSSEEHPQARKLQVKV